MNVLIVHAHPEPTSFNSALTRVAAAALLEAGHEVVISDLYAQDFDARAGRHDFLDMADPARLHYQTEQAHAATMQRFAPDLAREQARVLAADLLILQFPLWWGGPPAILKGWFDRVLAYGVAYVDGRRFSTGLFKGRRTLISVTTGGTPQRFRPEDAYGNIEQVLWPVRRLVLEYMGYDIDDIFVSYGVPRVGAQERENYLAAWRQRVLDSASKPVASLNLDPGSLIDPLVPGAWAKPT